MTGWRCGWAIGPSSLVGACNALQSHSTSNVCSITQKAAVAALTGPQDCVTAMLDEYRNRRNQVCDWLAIEPRLRVVWPVHRHEPQLRVRGDQQLLAERLLLP